MRIHRYLAGYHSLLASLKWWSFKSLTRHWSTGAINLRNSWVFIQWVHETDAWFDLKVIYVFSPSDIRSNSIVWLIVAMFSYSRLVSAPRSYASELLRTDQWTQITDDSKTKLISTILRRPKWEHRQHSPAIKRSLWKKDRRKINEKHSIVVYQRLRIKLNHNSRPTHNCGSVEAVLQRMPIFKSTDIYDKTEIGTR